MSNQRCPECGTPLLGVKKCEEYFQTLISWDFQDFAGVGQVHHLTVLCYYLQHPSHYSTEGLRVAVSILQKGVENNLSDTDLYKLESDVFSSSRRSWGVKGTQTNYGKYSQEIHWTTTVATIAKDGISHYPQHVKKWADSIYNDLKHAGELE